MGNQRIANRYAEAFMSSVEELQLIEKASEDCLLIKRTINESSDFRLLLKSPIIKNEKKRQIFEAIFSGKIQPLTLKFLNLLSDKNRENILQDIIEAFFHLKNEKLGIINVRVDSAAQLSAQQVTQLQKQFESYSKKKIQIDVKKDPKLIGGFIARLGDTMFDGSVRRQLELLRKKFTEESIEV